MHSASPAPNYIPNCKWLKKKQLSRHGKPNSFVFFSSPSRPTFLGRDPAFITFSCLPCFFKVLCLRSNASHERSAIKSQQILFHYVLKPIPSKKQSVFSGCLLNIILDVFKACGKTATYHSGILTSLSLSQSLILFSLTLPKFLASCILNTPHFLCFSCLCAAPFPKVYSCIFFFLVIFITLISKLASRNLTGSRHRSFFFLLIPDLWWYLGFTVPPQSSPLLAFAFIFPIIQKLCGGLLPCINRHSENIRFVAFYILFIWNIFSYYNISKKMSTLCWMNMQKEDQVSGQYASSYFPNVPANTQHFAFPTM